MIFSNGRFDVHKTEVKLEEMAIYLCIYLYIDLPDLRGPHFFEEN